MKTSLFLLLLVSALVAKAFAADPATPDKIRFTGELVTANGQPITGATAEFYQSAGMPSASAEWEVKERATADSKGVFTVSLPRTHTIGVIRHPEFAVSWVSLHNFTADIEQKIVLTPPTNYVGIVTDETGAAVAGAEVWIAQAFIQEPLKGGGRSYHWLGGKMARDLFSTRTLEDGRFKISGFPTNATANLEAQLPGKVLRQPKRQNMGPESMTLPGGQEIKLQLEPGGSLEGKVLIAASDQPLSGAKVGALLMGGNMQPKSVDSDQDGTFVIRDLPAGNYRISATFGTNTPPEWVAESVAASVTAGQFTREVRITATRGGILEVAVFDEQRRPLPGASINAHREMQGSGAMSSDQGTAVLRLTPGQYQVAAYKENLRSQTTSVTIEEATTNRVEIQFQPRPRIAGTVRDPDGKPAAGVSVILFPTWGGLRDNPTTDAEGKFVLNWDPQSMGGPNDHAFCLIARDLEKNLAVAEDIDEGTRTIELQMQPGLAIAGSVENAEGKPLTQASVSLVLWSGNMGMGFGEQPGADAAGKFKVTGLPSGRRYSVNASAEGYGSAYQQVHDPEGETTVVELPPFVLRLADQELAGQVLDEDEKPAPGIRVSIHGDGQPNLQMTTDQEGRFAGKVCEGSVRIYAHAQNSYCSSSVQSGDTNVVLQLHAYSRPDRPPPVRLALKGRALPDLSALGFSTEVTAASGPLLLCLFDTEQRPSRRLVRSLAEQYESIRNKAVTVLAVQAAVISSESMQEWRESNATPFPVGCLSEKTAATKWITEQESLPWLILTDAQHRVVDEGFDFEELEAKIEALPK